MFMSAEEGDGDSVEYSDGSPTMTVYQSGSRSWRSNNPGLLGFSMFTYQQGALCAVGNVAAFPSYAKGKSALVAMLGQSNFACLTVEQGYQRFVPSYSVPPPQSGANNSSDPPKRICPNSGLDADAQMSRLGGADRRKMADDIEQLIGYTVGTITKKNLTQLNNSRAGGGGGQVLINGRTAVHAGSNGNYTSPDVCKMPSGDGCSVVMYTNSAKSSDADKTASSVKINGHPACTKESIFSKSSGDEGGSCGGISSGTKQGKAEFIMGSSDVKIEGVAAVRAFDMMVSNNHNTPPMPLMQPGAAPPPSVQLGKGKNAKASAAGAVQYVEVIGDSPVALNGMVVGAEEERP